MRSALPIALGAALLTLAGTGAQADQIIRHRDMRALPPVSGTLRMAPEDFGHRRYARRASRVESVTVVRGGLYPSASRYRAITPAERWALGGTGVSGLIGNTGNPYAGETQWGTADSATTGAALAPRFAWQRRGLFTGGSLAETYGEPPLYANAGYGGQSYGGQGYGGPAYGATPQLPFYGSGTPYSMAYYSSGSSAGPYGSPGGLATYRSGSYGYGPRIVETGYDGGYRQGCTCGPRIVHLRRHHRSYSEY